MKRRRISGPGFASERGVLQRHTWLSSPPPRRRRLRDSPARWYRHHLRCRIVPTWNWKLPRSRGRHRRSLCRLPGASFSFRSRATSMPRAPPRRAGSRRRELDPDVMLGAGPGTPSAAGGRALQSLRWLAAVAGKASRALRAETRAVPGRRSGRRNSRDVRPFCRAGVRTPRRPPEGQSDVLGMSETMIQMNANVEIAAAPTVGDL
jgi:hypothetical protein